MKEQTLVVVKPGGVRREITEEVIRTYEDAGLNVILRADIPEQPVEEWKKFYKDLKIPQKALSNHLVYMASGPVVLLIVCGDDVIAKVRELNGATDPAQAAPGTIRARFGTALPDNAVHSSDSLESFLREWSFWSSRLEVLNRD